MMLLYVHLPSGLDRFRVRVGIMGRVCKLVDGVGLGEEELTRVVVVK